MCAVLGRCGRESLGLFLVVLLVVFLESSFALCVSPRAVEDMDELALLLASECVNLQTLRLPPLDGGLTQRYLTVSYY